MTREYETLQFKQFIAVPPSAVYDAFTNATALCEWLCNIAQANARKHGRLYMWWNSGYYASGEYIQLKPNQRVVFAWHGRNEPGASRVKVLIQPGEGGSLVRLIHSGLGSDKSWKSARSAIQRGWKSGLKNLRSVLETGQDLRFIRLPLLGISGITDVTPDNSALENLPVQAGLKIDGVMAGLGAQAAGLQSGDILVKVDGEKVAQFSDLIAVLRLHQSGDLVKIVYYRDGEKFRLKLPLSQRPIPEIPAAADELAELVERQYSLADKDLAECLQGISEAQAAYKPSPAVWSARENLAHLIANERETHSWVAGLIEGQEADFMYHVNLDNRVQAIVVAFPTINSLMQEFRRNQKETISLVRGLPAEFVQRKRSYWRLGYNLLEMPTHIREHCAQIHLVIEAAAANEAAMERNI